jgi:signal transduction histidine kinase
LVSFAGDHFLVAEIPPSPPVVLWWPEVELRAEAFAGATLTVGERPEGGVAVLQGAVGGVPVWLVASPAGGLITARVLLTALAATWVLAEGVLAALSRARASAEQRARAELLQRLSHDLRTPAAAVQALAEALRSGAAVGQEPLFLSQLEHESRRLALRIDGVLRAARGDLVGTPLRPEPLELRALLTELLRRWEARLGPVVVEGEEEGWVLADRARLEEALDALLDNAAVHGALPVRVGVRVDGARVTVEIQDAGPGIPPADRDRVVLRGEGRHTGLGLWVAADVAREASGALTIGDEARVTLSLPRSAR